MLRGVLHVHSSMSYDGQDRLPDLVEAARRRGYHFAAMSEHSDTLSQARLSDLTEQCQALSRTGFLVIPGVEYTCEGNLHLLAFGMRQYTAEKRAIVVAQQVAEAGGVPVIAHPSRYDYRVPEELAPWLAGIEVWNAGYDGRFVPNPRSFRLLEAFRRRNETLSAFCGQDVHRTRHFCGVGVVVDDVGLAEPTILDALRRGRFRIQGGPFRVNARAELSKRAMLSWRRARRFYESAKWLRDQMEVSRTVSQSAVTEFRASRDDARRRSA
jgi:predicted metal-dependent phosphoesterase TrpH